MEDLEVYHGKAINLDASDDRVPFHGAFLFHEMRVRSYWPLREDRAIPLPIRRVDWLTPDGDNGDDDGNGEHSEQVSRGRGARGSRGGQISRSRGGNSHNHETSGRLLRSSGPVPCLQHIHES